MATRCGGKTSTGASGARAAVKGFPESASHASLKGGWGGGGGRGDGTARSGGSCVTEQRKIFAGRTFKYALVGALCEYEVSTFFTNRCSQIFTNAPVVLVCACVCACVRVCVCVCVLSPLAVCELGREPPRERIHGYAQKLQRGQQAQLRR